MYRTLALCLLFTSCSTLVFENEGTMDIFMSSKSKGTKVKSYMEKREFYLWGIVPKEQVVPLDYALLKGGLNDSASNVSFGVYRSFVDTALAVITFGLYSPNHFIVKGSGEIFE